MLPGHWLVEEITGKDVVAVLGIHYLGVKGNDVPDNENPYTHMCSTSRASTRYFKSMATEASALEGVDRIVHIAQALLKHPTGSNQQRLHCAMAFLRSALADEGLHEQFTGYAAVVLVEEHLGHQLIDNVIQRILEVRERFS